VAAIQRPGFGSFPRTIPLPVSGKGLLVAAFVGLGLVGLLPVLESSSATTTGFTVTELEAQRDQLKSEVNQLESEVASFAALDYVERQATDRLGMVEPGERIFISVDKPAPALERLPSTYQASEDSSEEGRDPWWKPLADLLDFS
jgi:Septum formation initiator